MPRMKGQTESRSAWFRAYYREDESRLDLKNDEVKKAWEAAHKNEEWTPRHAQTMANVKSDENRRLGRSTPRKKRRKKAANGMVAAAAPARPGRAPGSGALEGLELAIDEVYASARSLEDRDEDMKAVVKYLRLARNGVIILRGKQ